MHRGLTLRDNGAMAICPPQSPAFLAQISAISIISPLHQRQWPHPHPLPHPASVSASFAALTKRRAVPAPSRARLFPTCLAAPVRAGIWNMAQNSLISTRSCPEGRGGGPELCVSLAFLFLYLQRGGAGGLIPGLNEGGRQLAVGSVNTPRDGPREAATRGPRARWCRPCCE